MGSSSALGARTHEGVDAGFCSVLYGFEVVVEGFRAVGLRI